MGKKTSIIAIIILIAVAVVFGLILVNKGDGPVAGVILSDKTINTAQEFDAVKSASASGLYLVLEKEYNKFTEKINTGIPANSDINASIYFVECSKGSRFTTKWNSKGKIIKEETKELITDQKGVISYLLEGSKAKTGSYMLELFSDGRKIFEYGITVK